MWDIPAGALAFGHPARVRREAHDQPGDHRLDPLRAVIDPAGAVDWPALHDLDTALDDALGAYPVGADLPAGSERSRRLLVITALLGATEAAQLDVAGHLQAELWGTATKAHGVDAATHTAAELALLLGASGYRADSPIAKTRRDLQGFQLADGAHESLLIAAGRRHILLAGTDVSTPCSGPGAAVPASQLQKPPGATGQAIRRPCSHNTVTPSATAARPAARRSATSGFNSGHASSST